MKLTTLRFHNVKSIENAALPLSPSINLLVGPNNSGKSTILNAVKLLQSETGSPEFPGTAALLRLRENQGHVDYVFDAIEPWFAERFGGVSGPDGCLRLKITANNYSLEWFAKDGRSITTISGIGRVLPGEEPYNLLHLLLSRRKVSGLNNAVNAQTQRRVRSDMHYLPGRLDRLLTTGNPASQRFAEYQQRVIGFQLSTSGTGDGKIPGEFIGDDERFISINDMGEGISNIAALLVDLAVARNKIFLIEELENDLHPGAIGPLLEILAEASVQNQFIVSTHSHIVVTRLGAIPGAKLFEFELTRPNGVPTTKILDVEQTPVARQRVLKNLGYTHGDLGHWEGFLILEESTAETVINSVLVPIFAPELAGRLRTVASSGVDDVERSFAALNKLFLYVHLSPVYAGRSWVRVDSGERGNQVINDLRRKFGQNDDFRFKVFSKSDFERYYPSTFETEVNEVLALQSGRDRQRRKAELARRVVAWSFGEGAALARAAWSESASEIISELGQISAAMKT